MDELRAKRDYLQLLHLHERLTRQLRTVREELRAPMTDQLLKKMRNRTGTAHDARIGDVSSAVEEAIRALKLSEAELREAVLEEPHEVSLKNAPNLPAPLARFLAERQELPGFHYEVHSDEVRGWIIVWKEHTADGTVRGSGRFYERPYAWLDD